MNAVRLAWLLGLAVLGALTGPGHAGELRVEELLADPSSFDGRPVTLRGTLDRVQAHATRKGNRYHTFHLTQQARELLVVTQDRPACDAGSPVRVEGRFDGLRRRVDAAAVTCE